jgi:chromosomal replication initiator protein
MIFDIIKSELQNNISENEFNKYIKNLKQNTKKSKSDLIVLEALNPLVAGWIKTKYASKIADLFESKAKSRPKIEIIVKNSKKTTNKLIEKISIENRGTKSTKLNPSYTFESFVVGSSNEFAYSICKSVLNNPAGTYNPVFIYGGVGLGKTHLLQAVGNSFDPEKNIIIYLTAEQFMNDFVYNLQNHTMDRFRDKYRNCDLLLVDDIQFLSGKERAQEEFFHTFEELHKNKKQIVLTADKIPKQIAGLEDRLKSRFQWGQVVDVQAPELETKIAIIKKKCEIDQIHLDDDIVKYIATNIDENIREIEGIIIKLHSFSKLLGKTLDLELTKEMLKDHINEKKENITIEEIIKIVSSELNIKPSEIKSKSRVQTVANARRMVFYLTRELTHNSMPTIAKYFGMKDHSAVSKALKKVDEMINEDGNLKTKIELLSNKISAKDE